MNSQPVGFKPTLPEGIWFLVRPLDRSATTALHDYLSEKTLFVSLQFNFLYLFILYSSPDMTALAQTSVIYRCICSNPDRLSSEAQFIFGTVLWIRNEIFRTNFLSSGSYLCYLSIFGNCKIKKHLIIKQQGRIHQLHLVDAIFYFTLWTLGTVLQYLLGTAKNSQA